METGRQMTHYVGDRCPGGHRETVIRFEVPLPPVELRSNARSHWGRRVKAKQEYSEAVFDEFMAIGERMLTRWKQAKVTFTWRACRLPDQANVLGNCKALLDILCMAPKSTQPNNTTYLGLIEDDKGVIAEGRVEKCAHRSEECIVIEIRRD